MALLIAAREIVSLPDPDLPLLIILMLPLNHGTNLGQQGQPYLVKLQPCAIVILGIPTLLPEFFHLRKRVQEPCETSAIVFVKKCVKVFLILRTCVRIFAPVSQIALHLLDLEVLEYVQPVIFARILLHVLYVVLVYALVGLRQ
tara:strand:+ start:13 stop:444 length:432 start_codon:yes stop_codon:yes gene_type:complete